ncbi:hypothetical protein BKA81DRAFT_200645 [Phyllosticta paracitricarpa]
MVGDHAPLTHAGFVPATSANCLDRRDDLSQTSCLLTIQRFSYVSSKVFCLPLKLAIKRPLCLFFCEQRCCQVELAHDSLRAMAHGPHVARKLGMTFKPLPRRTRASFVLEALGEVLRQCSRLFPPAARRKTSTATLANAACSQRQELSGSLDTGGLLCKPKMNDEHAADPPTPSRKRCS